MCLTALSLVSVSTLLLTLYALLRRGESQTESFERMLGKQQDAIEKSFDQLALLRSANPIEHAQANVYTQESVEAIKHQNKTESEANRIVNNPRVFKDADGNVYDIIADPAGFTNQNSN